jgi:hypothetical protein
MRSGLVVGVTVAFSGFIAVAAQNIAQLTRAQAVLDTAITEEETTGSIDRWAATQPLALTDEQRGLIFVGVINLPDVPDVDLPTRRLTAEIPNSVALQELPAMVTSRIPLVRDVRFLKLDDRILLVRPADRIVVDEIPRYRVWQ